MTVTTMVDLDPLHGCCSQRLREVYRQLFREQYWKDCGHDDMVPDVYDRADLIKERVLIMLKEEMRACMAYTGEDGIFYVGKQPGRRCSGIDFPFLDTELNEKLNVRITPTYEYSEEKHEVTVIYKTTVVCGKVLAQSTVVPFLRYNPQAFRELWRDLRTVIALVECWRITECR